MIAATAMVCPLGAEAPSGLVTGSAYIISTKVSDHMGKASQLFLLLHG